MRLHSVLPCRIQFSAGMSTGLPVRNTQVPLVSAVWCRSDSSLGPGLLASYRLHTH